jgi:hypothetical protein
MFFFVFPWIGLPRLIQSLFFPISIVLAFAGAFLDQSRKKYCLRCRVHLKFDYDRAIDTTTMSNPGYQQVYQAEHNKYGSKAALPSNPIKGSGNFASSLIEETWKCPVCNQETVFAVQKNLGKVK